MKLFEIRPLSTEMLFKGFSIFSSVDYFVQQSRTILAILVMWDKRPLAKEEMSFKGFPSFSSGSHFVQPSGTIVAILVEP